LRELITAQTLQPDRLEETQNSGRPRIE
jgi:hypothetical protein